MKTRTVQAFALVLAVIFSTALFGSCSKNGEGSSRREDKTSSTAVGNKEAGSSNMSSENKQSSSDKASSVPENTPELESSQTPDPGNLSTPLGSSADKNKLVETAIAQIGKPFAHGGYQPETGFDNSGLLYYVATQNGLTIPRKTAGQAKVGIAVPYEELQPGDFVFFSGEEAGVAQIGGVIIESGKMVISTKPGDNIHEQQITSNYWKEHFVCGVRL